MSADYSKLLAHEARGRRLDPNDPRDAAYLAKTKELLERELAWQRNEIARGTDAGRELAEAYDRLKIPRP